MCNHFKKVYLQVVKERQTSVIRAKFPMKVQNFTYSRILYEGGEVIIIYGRYISQAYEYFATEALNLDEDVHSWVLPDPNEECFFSVLDKDKYECVKLELVKHYIRNAAKFNS